MPKILKILLFFLFSIFFLPNTSRVLAVADPSALSVADPSITITHEPQPYNPNLGRLKVQIKSDKDIFTGPQYSYIIRPKGSLLDYCVTQGFLDELRRISPFKEKYWVTVAPKSTRLIEFDWAMSDSPEGVCKTFFGTWTLSVWAGNDANQLGPNSQILTRYEFDIEQPGGGIPILTPLQSPLAVGVEPDVVILNARKGNTYTFWWAKQRGITKKTATDDGNLLVHFSASEKTNPDTANVIKSAGIKTLCAEIGEYSNVLGLTERYCTTFDYRASFTPAKSCNIIPNPPREDAPMGVSRINLKPNQEYRAELLTQGRAADLDTGEPTGPEVTEKTPIGAAISSSKGTVYISFKAPLPKGFTGSVDLYETSVIDPICSEAFTILDAFSGKAKECKPDDPSCTTSAGEIKAGCTTDKNNPGISTAIGCIHTKPEVFVKDLMTFAIGIGGGISFLMMLLGAFQMLTSSGNPDTLKAGQDRLSSAIIGLLFIIFSVLLLQIIGVDILKLPDLK